MSLKSRYRLMRMRSRIGSGRGRRTLLTILLVAAGAFVLIAGLVMVFIIACIAGVVLTVLYLWSLLRRLGGGQHPGPGGGGPSGGGVTIEGEYTVQGSRTDEHKDGD